MTYRCDAFHDQQFHLGSLSVWKLNVSVWMKKFKSSQIEDDFAFTRFCFWQLSHSSIKHGSSAKKNYLNFCLFIFHFRHAFQQYFSKNYLSITSLINSEHLYSDDYAMVAYMQFDKIIRGSKLVSDLVFLTLYYKLELKLRSRLHFCLQTEVPIQKCKCSHTLVSCCCDGLFSNTNHHLQSNQLIKNGLADR